ncbi:MAG: discoidin domain-containing protein [Microcystaceae cyanobacterium]
MLKKLSLSTVVTVATLSVGTMAQAGTIVQPTGVSTSMGDIGSPFEIGNIIDQSGLSQTYTSGVDDFDTYIGLNPTHTAASQLNSYWASSFSTTLGQITFDLGSTLTTTRLAFWGANFVNQDITAFEVYSDDDGDFNNGGTTLLGNFNPTFSNDPNSAQVFDFTDATTQFIHFNVTANGGSADFTTLGEVAFEEGVATTPEPSSLIGLVVIGGGFLLKKAS